MNIFSEQNHTFTFNICIFAHTNLLFRNIMTLNKYTGYGLLKWLLRVADILLLLGAHSALLKVASPSLALVFLLFIAVVTEYTLRRVFHILIDNMHLNESGILEMEDRVARRIMEILVSIIIILTVLPLCYVVAAVIIKIANQGPVLKLDEAIDRKGRKFTAITFALDGIIDFPMFQNLPMSINVLMGHWRDDNDNVNDNGNDNDNDNINENENINNGYIQ